MEWIPLICRLAGSVLMGYFVWKSTQAANRREWSEAYYCLALAVMTLLVIK